MTVGLSWNADHAQLPFAKCNSTTMDLINVAPVRNPVLITPIITKTTIWVIAVLPAARRLLEWHGEQQPMSFIRIHYQIIAQMVPMVFQVVCPLPSHRIIVFTQ